MQKSTFARYGKLSHAAVVPCTHCEAEHTPKSENIRLHNRSELTRLLCPDCGKRDNEIMCACAKLMVAKGGFPPTVEQLMYAFDVRDEALPKEMPDPFEKLRGTYEDEPVTEADIIHWVNEKFFGLNRANGQLECMIDKLMEDADRALLLGDEGLKGRRMAVKRSQRDDGGSGNLPLGGSGQLRR